MTGKEAPIIVNLTAHKVTLLDDDNKIIKQWVKVSRPARFIATTYPIVTTVDGIPITKTVFSKVENLPPYDKKSNTYYIVSQVVKSRLPDRADLLIPAEIVKEAHTGKPLGCRSLGI